MISLLLAGVYFAAGLAVGWFFRCLSEDGR